ncbi:MAG: YfcE family phosphodiesterase [Anaerolineae bacterium]|nr:YfcE family phosphodiesterase [Anaerolineae bacterium]
MKIGILSDTHDDLDNLQLALDLFAREKVTTLLHCGDVCGPAVVEALQGFSVTFAQGNMDRMPALGMAIEALHGPGRLAVFHRLLLDGFQVALAHGHDEALIDYSLYSGEYAYIFCGHTHRRADRRVGSTRLINPGAMGGGGRHEQRSICIVDFQTQEARFLDVIPRRRRG